MYKHQQTSCVNVRPRGHVKLLQLCQHVNLLLASRYAPSFSERKLILTMRKPESCGPLGGAGDV